MRLDIAVVHHYYIHILSNAERQGRALICKEVSLAAKNYKITKKKDYSLYQVKFDTWYQIKKYLKSTQRSTLPQSRSHATN